MQNQLSLFASVPGVLGSFFWSHHIIGNQRGWFAELSLLDLLEPSGPLPHVSRMNVSVLCPGRELSRCPTYAGRAPRWNEPCDWAPPSDGKSRTPRMLST